MFDVRVLARPYLMTCHFPNPCEFANNKSSCPELTCKKDAPENSTKYTGKHFCQSLFFNKVAGLKPATLLKERLWHRRFPVNFGKFVRKSFFTEHLWWLLLQLGEVVFQKLSFDSYEKLSLKQFSFNILNIWKNLLFF